MKKVISGTEVLDNDRVFCRSCENAIRHGMQKRKLQIREIPKEFYKELTMRELYMAEMQRRRKEQPLTSSDHNQETTQKREPLTGPEEKKGEMLTTPFTTVKPEEKKDG